MTIRYYNSIIKYQLIPKDFGVLMNKMMQKSDERFVPRIESELEVKAFLQDVTYALENGAKLIFQQDRRIDEKRDEKYTNRFTVAELFPDKDPIEALKEELLKLTVEEYFRTVKDIKYPERKEFREFGKVYRESDEVYIKLRLEMFDKDGLTVTFVMSFHFAEKPFSEEVFPYKK